MDQSTIDAIQKINLIQESIKVLNTHLEALTFPILEQAKKFDSHIRNRKLISELSDGPARSMMLAVHIERMRDYEYRRQINTAMEIGVK